MIAEIFIFVSHLQRLLSMFERMSIFFDRIMNLILALNEIFSKHATNCGGATPSIACVRTLVTGEERKERNH